MVEDFATRDNIEKAKRGANFEAEIEGLLVKAQLSKVIDGFRKKPEYGGCFRPNFEVRKGDTILLIDATTTARTDRIKGKLWDAYNAKRLIRSQVKDEGGGKVKKVLSCIVVQKTEGEEKEAFERAKKYIEECSKPLDAVDLLLSVEEFVELLRAL
jgi:hypothetical protein